MLRSSLLHGVFSHGNRKSLVQPNLPTQLTDNSLTVFHFYKPPLFEQPPGTDLPDPQASPSFYPEVHVRYPESGSRPIFFPETFIQTIKFRIILNDVANVRFGGGKNKVISLGQAAKYYRRLSQWFEDLPPCLKPDKIVLPSHLNLQ